MLPSSGTVSSTSSYDDGNMVDYATFYNEHCIYLPAVRRICVYIYRKNSCLRSIDNNSFTRSLFVFRMDYPQMLGWFVFSALLSSYNKVSTRLHDNDSGSVCPRNNMLVFFSYVHHSTLLPVVHSIYSVVTIIISHARS